MTNYCSIGICLTESSWASVWGGFGGAAFAFLAAIGFEHWRGGKDRRKAVADLRRVIAVLDHDLSPFAQNGFWVPRILANKRH